MPLGAKKSTLKVISIIATALNTINIILVAVVPITMGLSPRVGLVLIWITLPVLNIFCIWSPILTFLRTVAIILNVMWIVPQVSNPHNFSAGIISFIIDLVMSFGTPLLSIFCIWFCQAKKKDKQTEVERENTP